MRCYGIACDAVQRVVPTCAARAKPGRPRRSQRQIYEQGLDALLRHRLRCRPKGRADLRGTAAKPR